jgi:hypothetical protein
VQQQARVTPGMVFWTQVDCDEQVEKCISLIDESESDFMYCVSASRVGVGDERDAWIRGQGGRNT